MCFMLSKTWRRGWDALKNIFCACTRGWCHATHYSTLLPQFNLIFLQLFYKTLFYKYSTRPLHSAQSCFSMFAICSGWLAAVAMGVIDRLAPAKCMMKAVSCMMQLDLVHCDLKPDNFMLSQGRTVVIDFGSVSRPGDLSPMGSQYDCPPDNWRLGFLMRSPLAECSVR